MLSNEVKPCRSSTVRMSPQGMDFCPKSVLALGNDDRMSFCFRERVQERKSVLEKTCESALSLS